MDIKKGIEELVKLYKDCPEVPCLQSGHCCVTPHLNFIEYLHQLSYLVKNIDEEKLGEIISKPIEKSKHFEGNFDCPIQKNKLCLGHPNRCLSCRLEGLKVIDKMSGRKTPVCINDGKKPKEKVVTKEKDIQRLLKRIYNINDKYGLNFVEPYFIDALNIQSWFSITFDINIKQKFILDIRETINSFCDIKKFQKYYVNNSKLKEKLDLIDNYNTEIINNNYFGAKLILKNILNNFPETGSYFDFVANEFLKRLNSGI